MAPVRPSVVSKVEDVGLKDAPLKSLFPPEMPPPGPVRAPAAAASPRLENIISSQRLLLRPPSAASHVPCTRGCWGRQGGRGIDVHARCHAIHKPQLQHFMRTLSVRSPCLVAATPWAPRPCLHGAWNSCRGRNPAAFLPPHLLPFQGAPRMKVAIVGGGLAGLSTAVELLDQG